TDVFSGVAAHNVQSLPVRLGDRTEVLPAAAVTGNFLQVLGVRPLLGRDFRPDEEGLSAPRLAILTHPLWRERFGSDPGVIRRSLNVDGQVVTVVGVLPPDFRWPSIETSPRAGDGLPRILLTITPGNDLAARRNATWIDVTARLRDGLSLASARSAL